MNCFNYATRYTSASHQTTFLAANASSDISIQTVIVGSAKTLIVVKSLDVGGVGCRWATGGENNWVTVG